MARIRIVLEDDNGQEIKSEKARIYDLSLGHNQLLDIELAVEHFKKAALPELEEALLKRAQEQFVTAKKNGKIDV